MKIKKYLYFICGVRSLGQVAGPCVCGYVCPDWFKTGLNLFKASSGGLIYGHRVLLSGLSFGLSLKYFTASPLGGSVYVHINDES